MCVRSIKKCTHGFGWKNRRQRIIFDISVDKIIILKEILKTYFKVVDCIDLISE
jgi:hypothetical protein